MFLAARHGGSGEVRSAAATVVDDVRELAAIMRRAVLSEKADCAWVITEGAGHNERAWGERFPEALRFLFGS